MAESNSTLESCSAKEKYPKTRKLTVLETVCSPTASPHGHVGVSYVPVQLEPCMVLRGKWLKEAGFTIGQKFIVTINPDELILTPAQLPQAI